MVSYLIDNKPALGKKCGSREQNREGHGMKGMQSSNISLCKTPKVYYSQVSAQFPTLTASDKVNARQQFEERSNKDVA